MPAVRQVCHGLIKQDKNGIQQNGKAWFKNGLRMVNSKRLKNGIQQNRQGRIMMQQGAML